MERLVVLDRYLQDLLEVDSFKDYSSNGIQVEGSPEVLKVATAVTASLQDIRKAVEWGADLLLVHHGILWKGDPDISVRGVRREKLRLLLENNITLAGYHLPLDAHRDFGNNWRAARELGWQDLEPFGEYDGNYIGVKGCLPKTSCNEFVNTLENYYGHTAHLSLGGKDIISSVALVSGGAHKIIDQAISEEVDCFITGSFDEPIWHISHEENINFIAMGHAATEKIGVRALGNHLSEKFKLELKYIDTPNPF